MNGLIGKAEIGLKKHSGKATLTGGGIGIASIYFIVQQMIAPLPTSTDLVSMELRLSKEITGQIQNVEKLLNTASVAYIEEMGRLIAKQDAHEKNFDFLRVQVERHNRKGPSAHNPD